LGGAGAQTITRRSDPKTLWSLGDGGPAPEATLSPYGIALDAAGNVYVADYGLNFSDWLGRGNRIRKVAADTGIITTIATGVFTTGSVVAIAADARGNILVADAQGNAIRKIDPASGIITVVAGSGPWGFAGDGGSAPAALLNHPFSVAVDGAGNIFIADYGNNRVRRVAVETGIITTIAGNGSPDFSGDGGPATMAGLPQPHGVAADRAGNVFIAEWAYNVVRRVRKVEAATGVITTVAGNGSCGDINDGGPATAAGLCTPVGVAVDAAGDLFITDMWANRIRRVAAETGIITTIAGSGRLGDPGSFSGDGGPATSAALNSPYTNVAVDAEGNVFIADTKNYRIRKVAAGSGMITTIAGNGSPSRSGERGSPRKQP
jgi:sugar lactone lactonase YvrE